MMSTAVAQEFQLSSSEKQEFMDPVTASLKKLIDMHGNKYNPGTTIDKAIKISDSEIQLKGYVNYTSRNCGEVHTEYSVNLIFEGSDVYAKPCILTPYCVLKIETGREWDCSGQKTQIGRKGEKISIKF